MRQENREKESALAQKLLNFTEVKLWSFHHEKVKTVYSDFPL